MISTVRHCLRLHAELRSHLIEEWSVSPSGHSGNNSCPGSENKGLESLCDYRVKLIRRPWKTRFSTSGKCISGAPRERERKEKPPEALEMIYLYPSQGTRRVSSVVPSITSPAETLFYLHFLFKTLEIFLIDKSATLINPPTHSRSEKDQLLPRLP